MLASFYQKGMNVFFAKTLYIFLICFFNFKYNDYIHNIKSLLDNYG